VLIRDPATVADIVHRVTTGYGPKKAQRSTGLSFGSDTIPTLDEFIEATKRLKIAAIRLTPA
jgi:type IV secretory pathway VirJ component